MPEDAPCDVCGEMFDPRGLNSHKRLKHPDSGGEEADENSGKPVREVSGGGEVLEAVESQEIVGVADDAIVFRNEIIVTDETMKERIADALVDKAGFDESVVRP